MEDIIKNIKALGYSNLQVKSTSVTIENEAKEQKWGFLGTLLDTSASVMLGNTIADKGARATSRG